VPDFETILTETTGRVGIIRLNRPQALNALSARLCAEVVEAAEAFDADAGIGAIVVTGSDRVFAAGADIKELEALGFGSALLADPFAGWDRFSRVRTPLVAAVAGVALGGGCELAMMCDLIVAADTARFGQPEINLGVIPGMGGTQRLTRAVGKYKAADLILTGRIMDADEAERAGLVSRVVPAGDLMTVALEIAQTIASKSLPVAYLAKEAIGVAMETPLADGVRFERRSIQGAFALDDKAEGMSAFREKRPPTFTHR
jgi:enoyl-CoA hydratase